jgi:hypothetical protein
VAWLPAWNTPFLRLIKCVVPGLGAWAFALRRQRSHVRIVSGAPILSGIFIILVLTENGWCHRSVTGHFKLTKATRGSFLATRRQRTRCPRRRHRSLLSGGSYLPDTRARLSRKGLPTAHERPEIFDRGSRGRNRRESFVLVCGGHEWKGCRHGHSFRKTFAIQAMPTGFER